MFELTKQQEMLREMVREFAETELAPKALELDRKGEYPRDLVKKLGEQGLIGMAASKDLGASGMGYLAGTIAIEELGRVYPSLAFLLEVSQAPIYAIEHYGTEEQKQKYLPAVIKGDKIMSIAATEATGGSVLAKPATEAVADGDGYIINGRKVYITNGGVADHCVVLAKTGEKTSTFIVDKDNPGFVVSRRQEMTGFKAVDVSEISFNDCRVSKDALIGQEGAGLGVAMNAFSVNRPAIGAIGLGIARGAFEIAVKYAKERILNGKPITAIQAIQFMLVDMETQIDAAKWLIYYPCAILDQGGNPQAIGKHAARAKVVGAQAALDVTQQAMQILGGYGVSPEYHLPRLLNDAVELFPAEGTSQVMKVIQAGAIIR
ncbi:MAG: acyl-CoA dehydrogenase family protein [Deltaproteobacteria bacterium]|nr:acyl-CoA dehydrogenase family protein [Deltaproteobacteria bacterium]